MTVVPPDLDAGRTAEAGLPIAKTTLCAVGCHVWVTAGSQWTTTDPQERCDCRLLTYEQATKDGRRAS